MSQAAEHALRTLGYELIAAAEGMPGGMGQEVMLAMGVAHKVTADRLQAEREDRDAQVYKRSANG